MPRKTCYWTRKLELQLVEFVRDREFIWRSVGNTNHHIQRKYKAYAEFAAKLGRGFTARSVRDRWVNIRSTYNHNLRKLEKSKAIAASVEDVYVPCWPLWKPLQFLQHSSKKEHDQDDLSQCSQMATDIKQEIHYEIEIETPTPRQRAERSERPIKLKRSKPKINKCIKIIDDLLQAMKPLVKNNHQERQYWFFGKHVTERLNCMREIDAISASRDIMHLIDFVTKNESPMERNHSLDYT